MQKYRFLPCYREGFVGEEEGVVDAVTIKCVHAIHPTVELVRMQPKSLRQGDSFASAGEGGSAKKIEELRAAQNEKLKDHLCSEMEIF